MKSCSILAATAAALAVTCSGHAASVSHFVDYSFGLENDSPVQYFRSIQLVNYNERSYSGSTDVTLPGFDASLGTLNQVTGTLNMNVAGTIYADPGAQVSGQTTGSISASFYSQNLSFPPFSATADDNGRINIDENASDTLSSSLPLVLSLFTTDTVSGTIASSFSYSYDDPNAYGSLQGLVASGRLTLTYDYTPANGGSNPNPNPIPTPSAAAAGLVALAALASRRRRSEVEA